MTNAKAKGESETNESLALVDAGIPVKGVVSAVECGLVHGYICTDLNNLEVRNNAPKIAVATLGKFTNFQSVFNK